MCGISRPGMIRHLMADPARQSGGGSGVRLYPSRADRRVLVILCPGAAHTGVAGRYLAGGDLRRVRLQMMQTAPLAERITTALGRGLQ